MGLVGRDYWVGRIEEDESGMDSILGGDGGGELFGVWVDVVDAVEGDDCFFATIVGEQGDGDVGSVVADVELWICA